MLHFLDFAYYYSEQLAMNYSQLVCSVIIHCAIRSDLETVAYHNVKVYIIIIVSTVFKS